MGLGKTIQVVALLAAYLEKTGTDADLEVIRQREKAVKEYEQEERLQKDRAMESGRILLQTDSKKPVFAAKAMSPILIVIPAGVVDNWREALQVWGHFSFIVYRGSGRENLITQVVNNQAEIALCPESVFSQHNDVEILNQARWKLIIVDEFHKFKNVSGRASTHLRALKKSTGCKVLGLTGTIMQNNLKELWNLVDLAKANILGSYESFEERYEKPIKWARYVSLS